MSARKMPTYEAVLSTWGPYLEKIGKVDPGELDQCFQPAQKGGRTKGICFACGFVRPIDKAHIKPRVSGGSDSADNIHLLCRWCHRISENLEGDSYFEWLTKQDMWSCAVAMAISRHPELAAMD